jgi:hypothetical protein
MGIASPWSVRPLTVVNSKAFRDPDGAEFVANSTEVDQSSANAEARMNAISNPSFPGCTSNVVRKSLHGLLGLYSKKYPLAQVGHVEVRVAQNQPSSAVRSSTIALAFAISAPGASIEFVDQSVNLQKGPVVLELNIGLEDVNNDMPISDPEDLSIQLDNDLTARLSEAVPMPRATRIVGGTYLSGHASQQDPNQNAFGGAICTLNKAGTHVVVTGNFIGARISHVDPLPIYETYSVNVIVLNAQSEMVGHSVSNQQTAYMNKGGQWSVDVALIPMGQPQDCVWSLGTSLVAFPWILITPPVPAPVSLS